MRKTQDLIDEASSLPIEERAILVDSLLQTMNPADKEIDNEWARVAKKRLDELHSGKVKSVNGEDVFKRVWKQFDK